MTTGGRSSLSDIMAAFNIPDQGDLPIQYSPIKGGTPPSSSAPSTVPGGMIQSQSLIASPAGSLVATPPGYGHSHSHHPYQGHPGQSSESTPVSSGENSYSSSQTGSSYQSDYHYNPQGMRGDPNDPENYLVYVKDEWPAPKLVNTSQGSSTDVFRDGGDEASFSYEEIGKPSRGRKSKKKSHKTQTNRQKRNRDRMRRLRQERSMEPEQLARIKDYDPFKAFRCVMKDEHKERISQGMTEEQKIELLRELQEMVKQKQREAMRARRARLTPEQIAQEKQRSREKKMQRRRDPLVEFRRFMTEDQKRQLMQPNLEPEVEQRILTELNAVRRWVHREQTRKRRARLSLEQREDVKKRSREYKRRARKNAFQTFKSVMTDKHYDTLQEDLTEEQKDEMMQELVNLKKEKQRRDMRARRAAFSPEQKEREREYSRNYKRVQRERTIADMLYRTAEEGTPVSVPSATGTTSAVPQTTGALQGIPSGQVPPTQNIEGAYASMMTAGGGAKIDLESQTGSEINDPREAFVTKNRERQRIRRAMQTEEEREEERRKNRERSRLRRQKMAEAEGRTFIPRWNVESGKGSRKGGRKRKKKSRNQPPDPPVNQPQHNLQFPASGHPNLTAQNQSVGANAQEDHAALDSEASDGRRKSRRGPRKIRANMSEEQRERERARNRERQRIKRMLQSPEERAMYTEKQRMERRRQRQDPAYRERERERQKERKKRMRENDWYRQHESEMSRMRRVRRSSNYSSSSYDMDIMVQQRCVDENDETSSDLSGSFTETETTRVGDPLQDLHPTNPPVPEEAQGYVMNPSLGQPSQQVYPPNEPTTAPHMAHMGGNPNPGLGAPYGTSAPNIRIRSTPNQPQVENSNPLVNLHHQQPPGDGGQRMYRPHEQVHAIGEAQNHGRGQLEALTFFNMDASGNAGRPTHAQQQAYADAERLGKMPVSNSHFDVHRITPLNQGP